MAGRVDALLAGPPPPPTSTRRPLGVPEGYTATRHIGKDDPRHISGNILVGAPGHPATQPRSFAPRYFEGDEWGPASLSQEDRARLQRAMVDAGLIPPKAKFRLGMWDEVSRAAYAELLSFANAAGLDERAALAEYAKARAQFGDQETRPPLTIKLTSPEDLRAMFETVATRRIGRKLRPEEVDRFVAAYQGQEAAVQRQAYAMEETGGTVTDIPDPKAFADARLRQEFPEEAYAEDFGERGNEFMELLGESTAFASQVRSGQRLR